MTWRKVLEAIGDFFEPLDESLLNVLFYPLLLPDSQWEPDLDDHKCGVKIVCQDDLLE
jgi:hypothetical protein